MQRQPVVTFMRRDLFVLPCILWCQLSRSQRQRWSCKDTERKDLNAMFSQSHMQCCPTEHSPRLQSAFQHLLAKSSGTGMQTA